MKKVGKGGLPSGRRLVWMGNVVYVEDGVEGFAVRNGVGMPADVKSFWGRGTMIQR